LPSFISKTQLTDFMIADQIAAANAELAGKSPAEIVRWAVELAASQEGGKLVVTTNFRPFEAVLLHLVTREQAGVPVLYADHGYNTRKTYEHAKEMTERLGLDVHRFEPVELVPIPEAAYKDENDRSEDEENAIDAFSDIVKMEPFARGMQELAPTVWLTALRRSQNPNRAGMNFVEQAPVSLIGHDGVFKINPLLEWSDEDMRAYLADHDLPEGPDDYFDPAKAGEKRECGLHIPGRD
jgi:phosphoadenosine phosphosulfate reductase